MPERIASGAAADICGITRKTLLRLAKAGKIPGAAELDEGLWRFNEERLRRWLRQREAEECRTTSTNAMGSGTRVSRLTVVTSDEAYEQLLGLKR